MPSGSITVGTFGITDSYFVRTPGRILQLNGGRWDDLTGSLADKNNPIIEIVTLCSFNNDLYAVLNRHPGPGDSYAYGVSHSQETWRLRGATWELLDSVKSLSQNTQACLFHYRGGLYRVGLSSVSGPSSYAAVTRIDVSPMEIHTSGGIGAGMAISSSNHESVVVTSIDPYSNHDHIVMGEEGSDDWQTWSPENGFSNLYSNDGSCVYSMIEYDGKIFSADDYGWYYVSYDGGLTWGTVHDGNMVKVYETLGTDNLTTLTPWTFFRLGNDLYMGTCGQVNNATCDIRKWDIAQQSFKNPANIIINRNTIITGQGFTRSLTGADGKTAYVSTGNTYYDGTAILDESKLYIFDGKTITDISPPFYSQPFPIDTIDSTGWNYGGHRYAGDVAIPFPDPTSIRFDAGISCIIYHHGQGIPLRQRQRTDDLVGSGASRANAVGDSSVTRQNSVRQGNHNTFT